MLSFLGPILGIGDKLIDKLIPDPEAKAAAKLKLLEMEQQGELTQLNAQMQAIMAEANSDSWFTSGARPSLMWVFSLLVLAALPIGLAAAIVGECPQPIIPSQLPPACDRIGMIGTGMKAYWDAFPSWFSDLATYCFLGYAGARTLDKSGILKRVANKEK